MHEPQVVRNRLSILGLVQGVGFRPFVWRRAKRFGLVGWVENFRGGLIAEVQGPARSVAGFLQDLGAAAPPLAVIERIEVEEVAAEQATVFGREEAGFFAHDEAAQEDFLDDVGAGGGGASGASCPALCRSKCRARETIRFYMCV